jgi:hypothetical protein
VVICSAYDPAQQQLEISRSNVAFLKKLSRMDGLMAVLDNLLDPNQSGSP